MLKKFLGLTVLTGILGSYYLYKEMEVKFKNLKFLRLPNWKLINATENCTIIHKRDEEGKEIKRIAVSDFPVKAGEHVFKDGKDLIRKNMILKNIEDEGFEGCYNLIVRDEKRNEYYFILLSGLSEEELKMVPYVFWF